MLCGCRGLSKVISELGGCLFWGLSRGLSGVISELVGVYLRACRELSGGVSEVMWVRVGGIPALVGVLFCGLSGVFACLWASILGLVGCDLGGYLGPCRGLSRAF